MTKEQNERDMLWQYIRGELPEDEVRMIEMLLKKDKELAAMKHVIDALREEGTSLPSAEITAAVRAVADRLMKAFRQDGASKDKHIGLVLFDSRDLPLPEGVRPAVVESRRLRVRIGDREVMLSLYPTSAEAYEMLGQVEHGAESGSLRVTVRGRGRQTTEPDRHGVFRFASVPAGTITLLLEATGEPPGEIALEL